MSKQALIQRLSRNGNEEEANDFLEIELLGDF